MNINIKYAGYIILLFLLGCFLAGCSAGSTIDTTLTINEDFSGTREMSISINKDLFNEYFNGSSEDLQSIITSACPNALSWNFIEDENMKLYFILDFASIDDYKQKISQIIYEDSEIDISFPSNTWADGIYIEENFESGELFRWLTNPLIGKGYVSPTYIDLIFSSGNTNVIYKDTISNVSHKIHLEKIDSVQIDSIDILTDINTLNDYSRKIIFHIPHESMSKKEEEIILFFKTKQENGCFLDQKETKSGFTFILSQENMTIKELEAFNKIVFGSTCANIVEEEVGDIYSPFVFSQFFKEEITLNNYVIGEDAKTTCNYFVSAQSPHHFSSTESQSLMIEPVSISDTYSDYIHIYSDTVRNEKVSYPLFIQKEFHIAALEVKTKRNSLTSEWTRTSKLTFYEMPDESDVEKIIEHLKTQTGILDTASVKENGTIMIDSSSSKNKAYQITITQKGTIEDILLSSEQLFNHRGDLDYGTDKRFWKIKKSLTFMEDIDFSTFLGNTTTDFILNYQVSLGFLADVKITTPDTKINMEHTGQRIDMLSGMFWLLILLGISYLLYYLEKKGKFDKFL